MTHPTDEELDALAAEAMDRSIERLRELAAYAGRPSWEKILREEISAPITALRTQLAEAQDRLTLEMDSLNAADRRAKRLVKLLKSANARADRAEADLQAMTLLKEKAEKALNALSGESNQP